MSLRAAVVIAAVSLAAMSLAGCTSNSTTTSSGGNPAATNTATSAATTSAAPASVDVCSLLTPAQASAIIGHTYTTATPATGQCSYATTDAAIPMFIIVSVQSWAEESATLTEDASGEPLVPISGVGDQAAGDAIEVGVQSGQWIIDIHGGDPDGTGAAFPKSIALAKAIIPQLP